MKQIPTRQRHDFLFNNSLAWKKMECLPERVGWVIEYLGKGVLFGVISGPKTEYLN